jgi:hypothetical protein
MSNIERWSSSAGANNASPPDGAPEGMAQKDFNDTLREVMAAVRRWEADPEWQDFNVPIGTGAALVVSRVSASVVRVAGADLTLIYVAGRRIRVTGAGTRSGIVVSSVFSGGNTDVTVTIDAADGSAVQVGANQMSVYFAKSLLSQFGTIASRALPARTHTVSSGGDQTGIAHNTETLINGLSNITVPGTPDGVKKYRVTARVVWSLSSGGPMGYASVRIRVGTNGNLSDTQVLLAPDTSGPNNSLESSVDIAPFDITPPASGKVSLSTQVLDFSAGTGLSRVFLGTTPGKVSYMTVEEILA